MFENTSINDTSINDTSINESIRKRQPVDAEAHHAGIGSYSTVIPMSMRQAVAINVEITVINNALDDTRATQVEAVGVIVVDEFVHKAGASF